MKQCYKLCLAEISQYDKKTAIQKCLTTVRFDWCPSLFDGQPSIHRRTSQQLKSEVHQILNGICWHDPTIDVIRVSPPLLCCRYIYSRCLIKQYSITVLLKRINSWLILFQMHPTKAEVIKLSGGCCEVRKSNRAKLSAETEDCRTEGGGLYIFINTNQQQQHR